MTRRCLLRQKRVLGSATYGLMLLCAVGRVTIMLLFEGRTPMLTNDNLPPTELMKASDLAHHLHPFTDHDRLDAAQLRIITEAEGVYIYDSTGKSYLDAMSGLWCTNIGYGRASVADAVARQMQKLPYYNTFFKTAHPPVVALSETLARLTPEGITRFFYTSGGSEANDTVLRLVRTYWAALGQPQKQIVIARHNAYHGSSYASASLGGMQAMHAQGGLPIPGIHHIDQPYWFDEGGELDPETFGLQRARALETAIERLGEDRIAAFIAEPVQGAGGVIIPPESYWPEIQRICDAHDILLIADEVICGFGRLGAWFGAQHYGIRPDIIVLAKGLTSGYLPLGAVGVSEAVAQGLGKGGEFFHGYTYSGHPAASAAALEVIAIMEREDLVTRVKESRAPRFAEKFAGLAAHPLVGEASTIGLLGKLELVPDKQGSRRRFDPSLGVGVLARDHCFNGGLIMRAIRDSLVAAPPLIITDEEMDKVVARAWQALDQTLADLKKQGAWPSH